MKKNIYLCMIALLALLYACSDNDKEDIYKTYSIATQLVYPENSPLAAIEGIQVTLYDTNEKSYEAATDVTGKATFSKVPAGVYRAVASDVRSVEGRSYIFNGTATQIAITNAWDESKVVEIQMTGDSKGKMQVVIKELYVGGCQKDDGSGTFQYDKYVILYNNSNLSASIDNLCLGITYPHNSTTTSKDRDANGKLIYEAEGWIPAGHGIWHYPKLTIAPYSDAVIVLNGGIDNTVTYSNSVNLDNPAYYYTYDITQYDNTSYYPVSTSIPTEHHWKAVKYGKGNGWTLSTSSPAFYIFSSGNTDPIAYVNNEENNHYQGGVESLPNKEKKIPIEWVIDGIEVFRADKTDNFKRLTSTIDVGQTYLLFQHGHTSYRNVDKEATEAIKENEGLLVYGYDLGTEVNGKPSTDPSGIDAEASIRKGAKIVYQDTNNSTNDFHQRKKASLRK